MEGAVSSLPAEPRPRALGASTMCEAFQLTAAERADQLALRTIGDGVSITFAGYAERVRAFAGAFHALGVRRADTLGLMLRNRPEFHLLDTAAMHLGATPFSIYNTSSPEQIAYLLSDAGNRVMMIYTSGTTGPPKGVQLTHANELAEFRGLDGAGESRPDGGAMISYLPTAHIADRGMVHYGQQVWGHTITTCPDPQQVFAHAATSWAGNLLRACHCASTCDFFSSPFGGNSAPAAARSREPAREEASSRDEKE